MKREFSKQNGLSTSRTLVSTTLRSIGKDITYIGEQLKTRNIPINYTGKTKDLMTIIHVKKMRGRKQISLYIGRMKRMF